MAISDFISTLLGAGARYVGTLIPQRRDDPATKSGDYLHMENVWSTINDILAGAECIRARGEKYLPKFPKEGRKAYERRRCHAAWRAEFEDTLRSLCSKPFAKSVTLQGDVPPQMAAFADDVDGQGNNITVFAKSVFQDAVAKG